MAIRSNESFRSILRLLGNKGFGDPACQRLLQHDDEFLIQALLDEGFCSYLKAHIENPESGYVMKRISDNPIFIKYFISNDDIFEDLIVKYGTNNDKSRNIQIFLNKASEHKEIVEVMLDSELFRNFVINHPDTKLARNIFRYDGASICLLSIDKNLCNFLGNIDITSSNSLESLDTILGTGHSETAEYLLSSHKFLEFYDQNHIKFKEYRDGIIEKLFDFHLRNRGIIQISLGI